ncbi:MAG: ImmA/IrrE family metallo-endopeptidase [Gemmataceae bacterium]|nr:ImmA/IrrE family metallo-endopeptidase [Gemmataceae bacterium]
MWDVELPRDDVLAVVDRAVAELLAAARIHEPPVDCLALAQGHLGIRVVLDHQQPQRGRAQRAARQRHIFLRPEPREERHQWTVAHEIGEYVKPNLLAALGIEPTAARAMMGESLANLFAHRLLVPTPWFGADAPACGFDLLQLKERYRTASHEVLALRFLDLPTPCVVTIVDNGAIYRRRSNAWRVRRHLAPVESRCQLRVHTRGEPCRLAADGWTVQGWPVHQLGWKREILRSVIEGDS